MGLRRALQRSPCGFLSRPSGAIRGRALAAGVPFPPAGSFQDAVLREVLFRERNRQYAVSATVISAIEALGHALLDGLGPPAKDEAQHRALHEPFAKRFEDLRRLLEEEVYEERYMPEFIREEERRERAKRDAALAREAAEKAAQARVASWSDE